MDADGGAQPVRLTGEDLTRVLVNLVKNAAEAMPAAGASTSACASGPPAAGSAACLALTIEDNGPGIPEEALEKIFTSGYTTTRARTSAERRLAAQPSRLGLAITRSIVETAGGRISAAKPRRAGRASRSSCR